MRGKNCLITGGLGFVGSNLAHELVAMGANVTIFDNCDKRFGANRDNIEGIGYGEISDPGICRVVFGDVRSMSDLARVIARQDYVFNCAAYISHSESYRDLRDCLSINIDGQVNLLDALDRFAPEAVLVYPSTTSISGPQDVDCLTENVPLKPREIYSATKAAAELLALAYAPQGLKVVCPRFTNLYGPRSRMDAHLTFMSYFLRLALDGQELPIFGEGHQIRNPLYIQDAVRAMILAAQEPRCYGEMFYVASDEHYRLIDIAHAIAAAAGGPGVRHIEWPKGRQEIDAGNVTISNEKAKRILPGWAPQTKLADGLLKTVRYIRGRELGPA